MGGRPEQEIKFHEQVQIKLKEMPTIFSDFYYHLYSNKSYTTIKRYLNYIKEFANFVGNGIIKQDFYKGVQPSTINKYFATIKYVNKNGVTQAVSDSIRATKWSALNTFFNYLEKNNYIDTNPMAKTERPKVKDNPSALILGK